MHRNILQTNQDIENIYASQKQKLIQKYSDYMFNSFQDFQLTKNPQKLKQFVIQNKLVMAKLLDQIYQLKQNPSNDTNPNPIKNNENSLNRATSQYQLQLNQQLEKQYQQSINSLKNINPSQSQVRQTHHLNHMESTLNQLNVQIKRLKQDNQQLSKKLTKTPFYKQWILMCKQAEGAKHYNIRLKQQLQKKKKQLEDASKQSN